MKEKYDVVMSLGYNCEVSFRIKDYLGKIDSYPYSWSYELDRNLFIKSLTNLNDLYSSTHTAFPWGMIKCDKYQISFHAKENKDKFFDGDKENTDIVENSLIELKSRLNHLIDKFYSLVKSDKKTLFLMKMLNTNVEDDKEYITNVYNKIKELYLSKNYLLVIVLEDNEYYNDLKKLENSRLKIRKIEKFATDDNTQLGGDLKGWNKVLSEFVEKQEDSDKKEKREYNKRRFKEKLWTHKSYRFFVKAIKKVLRKE